VEALIDVSGLTEEEIIIKLEEGQYLYEIAMDAELSQEEFFEMMNAVREDVFTNDAELWGEDHPHMWLYGRKYKANKGDGLSLPCFGWGESGSLMYGDPSQNNGW